MAPALADRLKAILLAMSEDEEGRKILQKTGETTKFDMLPEGEEGMRRRLLETFYSPCEKIEIVSVQEFGTKIGFNG